MDWLNGYNDTALHTGSRSISNSPVRVHRVYVITCVISQGLHERNGEVENYPGLFVYHVLGGKDLFLFINITLVDRCNQHEQNEKQVTIGHVLQSLGLPLWFWSIVVYERVEQIFLCVSVVRPPPSRQSWLLRPLTNSVSINNWNIVERPRHFIAH